MAESKMIQVARELLRVSKEGKAKWKLRTPRSYLASFPGIAFVIIRATSDSYMFEVSTDKGEVDSLYVGTEDETMCQLLREIFELARGQKLDTDLDEALDFLRST